MIVETAMFRSLLLLTLAAAPLAAGTAIADVYKYIDEKGNVQYTDKPPSLPAERLSVRSQRSDIVGAEERPQPAASHPATTARSSSNTANARQQAEELAKDKAERCIKARERYDRYMNSQKLFEMDANGERRYLDSDELDSVRASAKATMEAMCQ